MPQRKKKPTTLVLLHIKTLSHCWTLNYILLRWGETGRIGAHLSLRCFQPQPPLDNKRETISINTSKAAFCKKR